MGEPKHVKVRRRGPVARVTMARPEVHNAMNDDMIAGLKQAFDGLAADSRVRVVVLAGEGPSFSAGADLDWMRRAADMSEEENRRDAAALAAMLRAIAECPHPVVARVQGAALGGGAGLVAASDIAIAAESAQFGFTEVRLGLVPATVSPYVIEKIGAGRALSLFLLGERFGAARAADLGLVFRAVPDAELDAAVDSAVEALLKGAPYAQGVSKALVRRVSRTERGQVDAYTSHVIGAVRAGEEGREGVRGFLEKRRPSWAASVDARPGKR